MELMEKLILLKVKTGKNCRKEKRQSLAHREPV